MCVANAFVDAEYASDCHSAGALLSNYTVTLGGAYAEYFDVHSTGQAASAPSPLSASAPPNREQIERQYARSDVDVPFSDADEESLFGVNPISGRPIDLARGNLNRETN